MAVKEYLKESGLLAVAVTLMVVGLASEHGPRWAARTCDDHGRRARQPDRRDRQKDLRSQGANRIGFRLAVGGIKYQQGDETMAIIRRNR